MLLVVDLDLGAGVLADEDPVALLDVQRKLLAVVVDLALADGDDLGLLGFSLAVSGMMIPPFFVSVVSTRFTRIRSYSGRIFISFLQLLRVWLAGQPRRETDISTPRRRVLVFAK